MSPLLGEATASHKTCLNLASVANIRLNSDNNSRIIMLKYSIGPPSSIKASLDSLMKKSILYRKRDGSYRFADGFMPHWIEYLRQERPAR